MMRALKIKDFPDYYITDNGCIYTRKIDKYHNLSGRIIKKKLTKTYNGYLRTTLQKNEKSFNVRINRLVAEAFIPNPDNKPQVNHKNGIRTDNRVENLEWATATDNIKHSYRILGRKNPLFGKFGKENPKSKIVLQIKGKKIIAEYVGVREASRKTGVPYGLIARCCRNERKSSYGFIWKYKLNN